jgi:hypothetical protein
VLNTIVNKVLSGGKQLYCAFIDFTKAFDLVYRNGVWYKLLQMGVSYKCVNSIRCMYESIKSCVRSLKSVSDVFKSNVGVKQGETLSPMLFLSFINDMASAIHLNESDVFSVDELQLFLLIFADDTALFLSQLQVSNHFLTCY